MKSLDLHERLIEYLASWELSITRLNSFGFTRKNIGSETLYMNMINITYGCNLIEASTERVNFPAVDLIDRGRGLAVQITSDNSFSKIKKRIDIFNDHGMNKEFEEFSFHIIGQRSQSIKKGVEYGGIDLHTNVIDTKMFIDDIRHYRKLQEVCDYLASELDPDVADSNCKQDVNNQIFSGANIHAGAIVNVTTGSQTVNLTPQSLNFSSAKQPFSLDGDEHKVIGVAEIAYLEDDESYRELEYAISKIAENGFRGIESYEIDSIYKVLDDLEGTQYADLATVLWLLLYFENSALNSPSLRLKSQGAVKKQALNSLLNSEQYQVLEKFDLFQTASKALMSSIKCSQESF